MEYRSEQQKATRTLSRVDRFLHVARRMFSCLHNALYGFVLNFFTSLNGQVETRLTHWYMERETAAHFQLLGVIFKWIIFPASVLYVFAGFWYFSVNAIDSAFWGLFLFVYSNFLPDLPAVFCRYQQAPQQRALSGYLRYVLLLFAPLFVWLVFSGIPIPWRSTDTFHNVKATVLYALFLLGIGMIMFGGIIEACVFPLYGVAGYLTHLRVDRIS